MRFFFSPLIFIAGILVMKYSVAITDQFSGKIDLAEKYLGTGVGAGTYTWWKIFGLILCILSVLWLFNKLPGGNTAPSIVPTSMIIQMLV
jgi:hypothetical protein